MTSIGPPGIEDPDGLVAQPTTHRGHHVGFLNGEPRHRKKRRGLAHQRNIGAMQGGHGADTARTQHLLGEIRACGVRHGVMGVKHIQAVRFRHLGHLAARERQ